MNDLGSDSRYSLVAAGGQSTVVARYEPGEQRAEDYQSEAQLERAFIRQLEKQAYEYLTINSEADLVANLRTQLEKLNQISFTDSEWERFFAEVLANPNEGIVEKTAKLQDGGHIQVLYRDDGSTKNIRILDKKNIHNNRLQVLNQYENGAGKHENRYDVTILVNGLPLVHVELKRRGADIREAFNQIDRYQRDSFWAGSGLYEYIQIFVISNGTLTKYYSNTTREASIKEKTGKGGRRKTSNSYAFTIWWADGENKVIADLMDFSRTFFAKHTILSILTRYCVFDVDKNLMVMRPYQIVATERILNRIVVSSNSRTWGTLSAGGYIWHTTGSGKTLTSFKTAQLATELEGIDKVLFVVDRKDLDYQTMREYNRFEAGAANGNTSTAILTKQLEDSTSKIIVTTIQKLSNFVKRNPKHPAFGKHIVIIFDECHRSQFGEMHIAIRRAFKKYHLFGFTGTPIFAQNAAAGKKFNLRTTAQAFGDKLHTYTIVDAITDKNVLPFRIDYVDTIATNPESKDTQVAGIETETALLNPLRIRGIVTYIREHFDQKTRRTQSYMYKGQRKRGFNSILATASISAAKAYYEEFKAQQEAAGLTPDQKLKIAIIYSYNPNEADPSGIITDESLETSGLDVDSREFLDAAIRDYNQLFVTNFSTEGDSFENYYKDVSERMKNQELDLLIVVNMFLTGFDAKTLNTLWVDKNLRQHGLIQAFSRTNRILNSVKTFGNIVSFRNLEDATNDALTLFGNKDAGGIVLLKPYQDYFNEYTKKIAQLKDEFPLGKAIIGEEAQKEFVGLWGSILRLVNILDCFDEFADENMLPARDMQDYQAVYLELYREFRDLSQADKESIANDVVFEIELVRQVEVNVDYILMLVQKHIEEHGNLHDKEIRADVTRAINASPTLRNKKDLIEEFLDRINVGADLSDEWVTYVQRRRAEEYNALVQQENLKPAETHQLIARAFRDGTDIPLYGTAVSEILPPVSRFSKEDALASKRQRVTELLQAFLERFRGLGATDVF
ncbi:DEAD/DEAH box helicase [Actinobaculum suis]|uniref:type I restriction endonuclease subunit R n=1 Tax=Actinobaculum suis TaxID=1657 RepID=UPI0008087668|nr:type I restriction endonuclease subunit R [Actinobaculum suis]OCA96159.1 DEAD/DEAH box helicase [Actinobaculum suis]